MAYCALLSSCWDVHKASEGGDEKGHNPAEAEAAIRRAVPTWTVDKARDWINESKQLMTYTDFTDGQLEAIADNFSHAEVNGTAFLLVATDPDQLIRLVGLTIGEALHSWKSTCISGVAPSSLCLRYGPAGTTISRNQAKARSLYRQDSKQLVALLPTSGLKPVGQNSQCCVCAKAIVPKTRHTRNLFPA